MKATRRCSIDGCARPHYATDLCRSHYDRKRSTGDAGGPEVRQWRRGAGCSVDDCARPHEANGLCHTHGARVARNGSPSIVLPNGRWAGDDVSYSGAHLRVKARRGSASAHLCAHCAAPASDWAYDHADAGEKLGDNHGRMCPYSPDPAHYLPLCGPCHKRFDLAHIAGVI